MQSDDPEVRFRAQQILRVIRHDDRQRLINAFIAGVDIDSDEELPGWAEYQSISGNSDEARQLFVEMLEDEWTFLDSVYQSPPHVASSLLTSRVVSLELGARQKRSVSVGSVAALLLVAAEEDIQLSNQANLMSLCYRSPDFDAAIRAGGKREALRALMGKLIGKSSGNPYLTQRFHFALYYDLKEGLGPARQVVSERLGIPHVRQYALLVLGKMGDEEDLKLVENLLDDPGIVSSHNRVNRVRITTQVRDVALAVLLHRAGADFQAYGLPEFKENATTMIQTSTVGFASDEEREQAIQKWRRRATEATPAPKAADATDPPSPE